LELDSSMTFEQLREIHQARPFQPFRLQMANGDEVAVPHPEFLWFPPQARRSVRVATSDETTKLIDVPLVVSIEVGNEKATRRRKRKRRRLSRSSVTRFCSGAMYDDR